MYALQVAFHNQHSYRFSLDVLVRSELRILETSANKILQLYYVSIPIYYHNEELNKL